MKKFKHFSAAIICMFLMCAISPAYGRAIQVELLPAPAKAFIHNNFRGQKIVLVDRSFKKYEVLLANGTKIEFDSSGTWNMVKSKAQPVPCVLVPANISKYVKTNFSNSVITKIEKERYGYEVKLLNGVELQFSPGGEMIGLD